MRFSDIKKKVNALLTKPPKSPEKMEEYDLVNAITRSMVVCSGLKFDVLDDGVLCIYLGQFFVDLLKLPSLQINLSPRQSFMPPFPKQGVVVAYTEKGNVNSQISKNLVMF
jgi:hypothetical protein